MGENEGPAVEELVARARAWFDANAERREEQRERAYGEGSDDVAVFRTLGHVEEEAQIRAILAWQGRKVAAGLGALTWPVEYGGQGADLGYLIARTDPAAPRQTGCTAFVVAMDAPGIKVRPLQQMSGGTSFNEVFFDGVRIPDTDRIGEVGAGWAAAMTTLAFERVAAAALREGGTPGPEGSIGKLAFTNELQLVSAAASLVVGTGLLADTGEWGTFAWVDQITGTPGMRIAGGTDEIQRNTIGERVLGLPREPR